MYPVLHIKYFELPYVQSTQQTQSRKNHLVFTITIVSTCIAVCRSPLICTHVLRVVYSHHIIPAMPVAGEKRHSKISIYWCRSANSGNPAMCIGWFINYGG